MSQFSRRLTKSRPHLRNVRAPNLLREHFSFADFPKLSFDGQAVACALPEDIWLTDTTFRDGQQARPPFRLDQILKIYDLLHRIDGGSGLIRQSEFFLYSQRDRNAACACLDRHYRFPEIIGWIRSKPSDLDYVSQIGLKETGILMSVSDYHIFLKLGRTRQQALDDYLSIVRQALDCGITPRCHLEDITRADFDGFVLPLVDAILNIGQQAGVPLKIRLCDTLGLGVPYPEANLPRSVPKIITKLRELGVQSQQLEWHGHNDFHKAAVNGAAAWLYGCCSVNCTVFGVGERTGNPPLEALLVEQAQLQGNHPLVNYTALAELAELVQQDLNFEIPNNYPLVGRNANVTRAGIHADGMLKHTEVYSGFDADKLLNRPPRVTITDRTGRAGIAYWINTHFKTKINKGDPRIDQIKQRIDQVYTQNRTTSITDGEMQEWVQRTFQETDQ